MKKLKSESENPQEKLAKYIAEFSVKVFDKSEVALDHSVKNKDAFVTGNTLFVAGDKYTVNMNAPNVLKVKLPSSLTAGFPTYPIIEMEFAVPEKSKFVWYAHQLSSDASRKRRRSDSNPEEWREICRSFCCTLTDNEIGKKIKLVCIPYDGEREGKPCTIESAITVQEGPGVCPFEKRQKYTQDFTAPGSFRVMTYNILADLYADSEYSRDFLFPACPEKYLNIDYRKLLFVREILGYKSDVICLQEVDKKIFNSVLQPIFKQEGYEGSFRSKNGELGEGCATFFRESKFRMVLQSNINLIDNLESEASNKDLLDKITSSEILKEKVLPRKTSLQVTVLESVEDPKKKLIVATTHLYFHPRANNVRIIQGILCMRHIQKVVDECRAQGFDPTLVFCGDFNNGRMTGVHTFLKDGVIPATHCDWMCDMNFKHDFRLESACGYPIYTNYVPGFNGCIDYIYIESDKLEVTQVIPMPTHEEVTQYTALPNMVFPSDHIALICDLKWKK
ncbi:hypothetical protein CAPTEDRAFT_132833 [Capitella teleta]|uniref:2',5'-phosphodiesterase 12 n=1 Tax=Capitella teleta TaxID=283909 RepID=R7TVX1_CAPTE|nr:hypothetical protein CAPTEDRAFT_132833 [Capitella teleta]|eukprot:ELT97737.1 hypothetical protein CAPTEDRAFT_132833 [Capitella teleta]